ncbi:MAG: hypothetical protein C5S48_09270 [Candidatus Methanogaster sp.]|nr:MAG: hypothetical protein C5S48_09270 [ANME-2 cluster archaeon]
MLLCTTGETSAQPSGLQTRHLTARSRLRDNTAGLDVSTACYKYSNDGGLSWSGWLSASCTGSDGTTSYQTITAGSVPFNRDSGTQNMIKFKINDTATNTGESDEYAVWVDVADPSAPAVSSPTHPDEGVATTEIVKYD